MKKGIIYYTDNRLGEPLFSIVQKNILNSGLPIVSCSLKPINFGKNIVVEGESSYPTMVRQIITALEASDSDYVFFCENDVLYPKTHFDFEPKRDDIFYYNGNVWRWWIYGEKAITYDRLISLSGLCVNRNLALENYKIRLKKIEELEKKEFETHEPRIIRVWGYEPGTKKKRRGGITDDDFEMWYSEEPIVDLRHDKTFTCSKVSLSNFKHQPIGWIEITIDKINYWNLREIYNSCNWKN
jgi:hypothetical protein